MVIKVAIMTLKLWTCCTLSRIEELPCFCRDGLQCEIATSEQNSPSPPFEESHHELVSHPKSDFVSSVIRKSTA